ncbi:MAG: WbqC family protein [Flavobacteriaceae bacterium]|nr:WbqC family protein [Flavobacteriaceae bacterium]
MIISVCPAYLPSVEYMSWVINQKKLYFLTSGHYQKQTYRNRAEIYGPNGKLKLIIPVTKNRGSNHQKDIETMVDNNLLWQKNHWRSLQMSYRASPYFEFYEEDFYPFYNNKISSLMELNIGLIKVILKLLKFEIPIEEKNHNKVNEKRDLIVSKKIVNASILKYNQVFIDKHGFLSNLSIVDLLFNLGPESLDYLKNIRI